MYVPIINGHLCGTVDGAFSSATDEERLTITPPFFSSNLGSTVFVIYKRMGDHVQLDYDSMSGEMCMCECEKEDIQRGGRERQRDRQGKGKRERESGGRRVI